ncbi:MAG: hypothetical protein ABIF71_06730 [Planctomycetota bacterium]
MEDKKCRLRNADWWKTRSADCGMRIGGRQEVQIAECGLMEDKKCRLRNADWWKTRSADCGMRIDGKQEVQIAE